MGDRAQRRANTRRMKRRARRIYPDWLGAVKAANHLKICSCWMCGHARRWFGKTRQEKMAEARMNDE